MTRIGVISDTHGYLDPAIPKLFAGVDHILHGGDIGLPRLILELEQIAPVTAVLGNTDAELEFKETEIVQLNGHIFLVHHIVDVDSPAESLRRRIALEKPNAVVFGHSHRRFCQTIANVLYFNPGYAGKPRFKLLRSVAILTCDASGISPQYFDL